jgi:hypothetical protein
VVDPGVGKVFFGGFTAHHDFFWWWCAVLAVRDNGPGEARTIG